MSPIEPSKSGIYSVTNTINGKVYVGKAVSIRRRIGQHRSALRNGKHGNPYLQASWKEYGEAAFQFAELEYCEAVGTFDPRETFWVHALGSLKYAKGFNLYPPCPFCFLRCIHELAGLNRLDELMEFNLFKLCYSGGPLRHYFDESIKRGRITFGRMSFPCDPSWPKGERCHCGAVFVPTRDDQNVS